MLLLNALLSSQTALLPTLQPLGYIVSAGRTIRAVFHQAGTTTQISVARLRQQKDRFGIIAL